MVGYLECFRLIWETCKEEWYQRGPSCNFLTEFLEQMKINLYLERKDVVLFFAVAIVLTLIRQTLTKIIFQPVAEAFNFTAKEKRVFPESSFKILMYSTFYTAECYMLISTYPGFLYNPKSCWIGWKVGMTVPADIYWIYIGETGFYLHGIYSVIFLDLWRDDSLLMIVHHVVTISLIVFSLALRYHRIGIVVLFLHDIADVLLELTKIFKCFSSSKIKKKSTVDSMTSIGFVGFAFSWIFCRLVMYPVLVLYSTGHVARTVLPDAPFYFFFNGLLWLLFFMNIWWCHLIILVIYRVTTGKSRQVEDVREHDEANQKLETTHEFISDNISKEHCNASGTDTLRTKGYHENGTTGNGIDCSLKNHSTSKSDVEMKPSFTECNEDSNIKNLMENSLRKRN